MFKNFWEMNKTKQRFKSSTNKYENRDAGLHQTYPIRKGINYGSKLQAAKGTFLEYFKESSIHGFKYIGNHRHSVADRFIWLCALVLSIVTCCFLIRNIWNQRVNNPVIVTFNEKLTHVWEIPFPSVTICPEIKTNPDVFNYTEIYWKIKNNEQITDEENVYLKALNQICFAPNINSYNDYFANASDLKEAMIKLAPNSTQVMVECLWRDSENCTNKFKTVLTEDGICYSFNSLTSNHYSEELKNANIQNDDFYNITGNKGHLTWSVEKGYTKGDKYNTFPIRALGSGDTQGLALYLVSLKQHEDLLCQDYFKGFKVVVHTPGEEPQVSKKYMQVPPGKTSLISIKPKIIVASEKLLHYEPFRRKCFYQHERPLRYFKVYNQPNCELECLANQTLANCGCVRFEMPRNSTDRVCGAEKLECVFNVTKYIDDMNFEESTRLSQSDGSGTLCDCLPLCTSIQYKAELEYQNDIDYVEINRANKHEIVPGEQLTEIMINFKENLFNGLKRSELYSEADLIASCGGLLGLFMGVSILSFVELVYYFTVKLWANLKTRNLKNHQLKKFKEIP